MTTQPGMKLNKLKEGRAAKPLTPFPISDKELCERYEALFTAAVTDVLRD
jgi:4-hydroxy-4-methyl-2-oxoglutarate aldolase